MVLVDDMRWDGMRVAGHPFIDTPNMDRLARDWRSSFLIEYYSDTVFPRIRNMGYVAARTARHKYIQYHELRGMDELYDLDSDPYEETNIIGRVDARETLQQMQAELRRLLERTGYVAPVGSVNPAAASSTT